MAKTKQQDKETGQLKVLLLHALNGKRRDGRRAALERHFQVFSPATRLYLHAQWTTNPVLAQLLFVITISFTVCLCLMFLAWWEKWWQDLLSTFGCLFFLIVVIYLSYGLATDMHSEVILNAVESCVDIHRKAIEDFQPDVIVGDEFGGAIAVWMLQRGVWKGPTVLLAPAYAHVAKLIRVCRHMIALPPNVPVIIAHHEDDPAVPFVHSQELIQTGQLELTHLEVLKGSLENDIGGGISGDKLCHLIRTAHKMKKLSDLYGVDAEYIKEEDEPLLSVRARKIPGPRALD